jgi:hypothetical protein
MDKWYGVGMSTASVLIALAGTASAAGLAKGYYEIDGYITQSTCGTIANLKVGTEEDQWSLFPGASAKGMQLAIPDTSSSGGAGDATSTVCLATTAIPAGGLGGATLTFDCYNDTDAGEKTLAAQLKTSFKVGASHDASVWQVSAANTLIVSGKTECTYTTDATWTVE